MKYFKYAFISSFILLLCYPTAYGRRSTLRLGRQEDVSELGLKLKIFKKIKPVPLSTPNATTLTGTDRTGKKVQITAYSKHELWKMSQTVAKWNNSAIGSIAIYSPKYPPADNLKCLFKDFLKKESFDKWLNSQKGSIDFSTDEKQLKWMQAAFGNEVIKLEWDKKAPLKQTGIRNFKIIPFGFEATSEHRNKLIYLMKAKSKRPSFVISYTYSENIVSKKAMRIIYASLKSIKLSAVKKGTAVSKSKSKFNKNETPEFRESRERTIRSIKNSKGWWYLTTENYIIASNLKDRTLIKKIKINIERARKIYQRLYPIKHKINAISVIKVFKDRDTYVAYVGNDYKWTGGIWMSGKKELVISPLSFKASRKMGQTNILTTLYHEGFHQYLHYAAKEKLSSVWFNEGSAQFFEGLVFKNKSYVGMQKFYFAKMLHSPLHVSSSRIQNLLAMGYKEFYDENNRRKNYTLAFAIVYYLWKGAPSVKNLSYSDILPKYYAALTDNKSPEEATTLAWYGVDMEAFASDLSKFWSKKRSIKHSVKFKVTPKKRK